VCIFIHKDPHFSKINISYNYKEKDLEICAIELKTKSSKLIISNLYTASTGDFNQFTKDLNEALKHQNKPTADLLICREIKHRLIPLKKKKVSLLTT
jgi:hypothetical protein